MNEDRLKKLTERSQAMEKEFNNLSELFTQKKAEIKGLVEGLEKFKDNQKLKTQLEGVIKQRYSEVKNLNLKVEELKREYRDAKEEMNKVFSSMQAEEREIKATPKLSDSVVKPITISPSVKTEKRAPFFKISLPNLTENPIKKEDNIEKERQEKIAPKLKPKPKPKPTPTPKNDLYDKAASEAKAQEEFLKNQKGRTFGSA